MLADEIKTRLKEAMKSKKVVEKEILRVLLGEIQTIEARQAGTMTDEEAFAVVRKLVKSNRETLEQSTDSTQRTTLEEEISILESLLPKTLSEEETIAALGSVAGAIRAAGNDGQATGVAMKHLRSAGAQVDGKTVSSAVKKIRAE